ncbi:MAG TPA: HAD family phosphatase [Puia sp.]|nr:HAD family phosphatase [Puia sp.]
MKDSSIKNIIFDLGGVILNIDPGITERAFQSMGAKDFRQYFGHGFALSFFSDYEVGKISDQQFINDLKTLAGVEVSNEVIVNAWNALLLDFPPQRIELLKILRKKYRLYLFSNTNALHLLEIGKMYKNSFPHGTLDDLFEKAYYSHLLQLRKPDKASFEYIINENQLDPSETLFVDDAIVNVEGANAVGLRGLYLPPGMTILDLTW